MSNTSGAILALAIAALAWAPGALRAQAVLQSDTPDETVQVTAGSVFEIKADADGQAALVSWKLSQNSTFMEAGNRQFFQTRLAQPGTYLLEGSVDFPMSGQRIHKNIMLDVVPATGAPADTSDSVRTAPPSPSGIASLPAGHGVVVLIPSPESNKPIRVDADTAYDSNGDGNTSNDDDSAGSMFATEGNALAFWFVSPRERGMLILTGQREQYLGIRFGESAPAPTPAGTIVTRDVGDGDVTFTFETGSFPDNVVHTWSFGDGQQSMIRQPTHRYLQNGTYQVAVTVRDLGNGSVAGTADATITVSSVRPDTGSGGTVIPEPSTPDPEPATPDRPLLGGMLPLLLRIAIVGLLAIALGALAMWLISKILRRTGGSFQKRLADAEAKIVGDDKTPTSAPATLELRRPAAAPEVVEAQEKQEPAPEKEPEAARAVTPPPSNYVDVNQAPAWLKQGLKGENAASAPEPAPVPAPAPAFANDVPPPPPFTEPPAPAASVPEPASAPPLTNVFSQEPAPVPADQATVPAPPAGTQEESLPPWLRQDTTPAPTPEPIAPAPVPEPVPSAPAPAFEPAPAATPAPEPAPIPAPAETPAPAPEPVLPPAPPAPLPAPEPVPPPAPLPVATVEPPVPAPIAPAPVPAVIPTPDPVPPAPIPEPAPPAPPAPVVTPELAPVASVTPAVPAPVATPVPAQTQTSPAAPAQKTQEELKREEAERERKRRKRQRYRENLKKRAEAEKQNAASPASAPAPAAPAPVTSQEKKVTESPAPMVQESKSAPVTPDPTPAAPGTPAPAPTATPTPVPEPAPVQAPKPAPIPQDIPPAESPVAPVQKSDDAVVFEIKAEGVGDQKPQNGPSGTK